MRAPRASMQARARSCLSVFAIADAVVPTALHALHHCSQRNSAQPCYFSHCPEGNLSFGDADGSQREAPEF